MAFLSLLIIGFSGIFSWLCTLVVQSEKVYSFSTLASICRQTPLPHSDGFSTHWIQQVENQNHLSFSLFPCRKKSRNGSFGMWIFLPNLTMGKSKSAICRRNVFTEIPIALAASVAVKKLRSSFSISSIFKIYITCTFHFFGFLKFCKKQIF